MPLNEKQAKALESQIADLQKLVSLEEQQKGLTDVSKQISALQEQLHAHNRNLPADYKMQNGTTSQLLQQQQGKMVQHLAEVAAAKNTPSKPEPAVNLAAPASTTPVKQEVDIAEPAAETTTQSLITPQQYKAIQSQIDNYKQIERLTTVESSRGFLDDHESNSKKRMQAFVDSNDAQLPPKFKGSKNSKELQNALDGAYANAKVANKSAVDDYTQRFGHERFGETVRGKNWDKGYSTPSVGDNGEVTMKFPNDQKAIEFHSSQAKGPPVKAFIITNKKGEVTAYSDGDGKLRKPDGNEFVKGRDLTLSAGEKPQKLADFTMPDTSAPKVEDKTNLTPQ